MAPRDPHRRDFGRALVAWPGLGLVLLLCVALAGYGQAQDGVPFDFLQPASRPAPGLGGDPFRSSLDDAAGWWGRPRFSVAPTARLSLGGDETMTRRTSDDHGDFSTARADLGLATSQALGWSRLWLAGRQAGTRRAWEWEDAGGALGVASPGRRTDLAVRLVRPSLGLTLQVAGGRIGARAPTGSDLGGGIRLQIWDRARFQATRVASWRRDLLTGRVRDELWNSRLNARVSENRMDVGVTPWQGVIVEASLSHAALGAIHGRKQDVAYQLFPEGDLHARQGSLGYRFPGRLCLLARATRMRFAGRGTATWGGQRCGNLSRADASAETRLFAIEQIRRSLRLILDAEWGRLDGSARAQVEFWPLTSSLVDLLGPRRTYLVDANVRWHRLHLAGSRQVTPAIETRGGLGWWDLRPRGQIVSWRPQLLVFGRADERWDVLSIRRVQLAAVSAGGTVRRGDLALTLDLQQVVFAQVFQPNRAPGTESGDTTRSAPPPAHGRRGGSRVEFAVTWGP